ncbi:hypothetical protein EBB07_01405 [Paenibacillaceae bacterium]|nr:hypothetical protein EBB07_01405 [Paenibacillaceae bacterium]
MPSNEQQDETVQATPSEPVRYGKAQFLASSRFTPAERDLMSALLKDNNHYTAAEAEQAVQSYLRKEVK